MNEISSEEWAKEVFPHSAIEQLASDLWVVQGCFPKSPLPRNMVIHRFDRDKLLLHSVVALEERAMRELEALGTPSVMMIPNWDHWAHVVAFKRRYPALVVVCPEGSRWRVERRLRVDATCEQFFPRHGMRFETPPGMLAVEGVLELTLERGGKALVMNDLVTNMAHQPGVKGLVLRLTRSTGPLPRMIPIVKRQLGVRAGEIRRYFEALARRSDLAVLTTSHGTCLQADVTGTLRRIAAELG